MKALRRAFVALGVAGAIASALRLFVRSPGPARTEAVWRELSGPEMR